MFSSDINVNKDIVHLFVWFEFYKNKAEREEVKFQLIIGMYKIVHKITACEVYFFIFKKI